MCFVNMMTRLRAVRRGILVRFPVGAGGFCVCKSVHTNSVAHPSCVPGDLSLRLRRPGREFDHPPQPSSEIKNAWNYVSIPPMFLRGIMVNETEGQL
jgi:hypothetical protein